MHSREKHSPENGRSSPGNPYAKLDAAEVETFAALEDALSNGHDAAVAILTEQAARLASAKRLLVVHRAHKLYGEKAPAHDRYVIGGYRLHTLHRLLTRGSTEWMAGLTGPTVMGTRCLADVIEIASDHQSVHGVTANDDAVFQVLRGLESHGHALHALIHSHRIPGPPRPSGTDLRMQEVFDAGGYETIQMIASEDGFFRFFAGARPFTVDVFGSSVEKIDDCLFRIKS